MKHTFFLTLLLYVTFAGFAQRRQADSLRLKQMQYNQQQLEQAKKKREEANSPRRSAPTSVVTYDSKGNKVETFKTKDGQKVTTTVIKIPPVLNRPFSADSIDKDSVMIKVTKSKFRMQVYHKGNILTAYKCVFGPNHLKQKQCEGDRCTPEGIFTILDVKKHDKWDIFMLLDYPNEESLYNFEKAKLNNLIPASARIGGAVGIHGIWTNGDNVIDLKHNWTDGCVALKNKDVEELSQIIKPGVTKIMILK